MKGDAMTHALSSYQPARHQPWGTYVLNVTFSGPNGERCSAIGVGSTVDEALAWARESAPHGTAWLAGGWSNLYGD
jgi:hypothetical protein